MKSSARRRPGASHVSSQECSCSIQWQAACPTSLLLLGLFAGWSIQQVWNFKQHREQRPKGWVGFYSRNTVHWHAAVLSVTVSPSPRLFLDRSLSRYKLIQAPGEMKEYVFVHRLIDGLDDHDITGKAEHEARSGWQSGFAGAWHSTAHWP